MHSQKVKNKETEEFEQEIEAIVENTKCDEYDFTEFVFDDFDFRRVFEQVQKPVHFDRAHFRGIVRFNKIEFPCGVDFHGSRFDGHAWFRACRFLADATFFQCTFAGDADFTKAQFLGESGTNFDQAQFNRQALFDRTTYVGKASFYNIHQEGYLSFDTAKFEQECSFHYSLFEGTGRFDQATFQGEADFRGVQCKEAISFRSTTFSESLIFAESELLGEIRFRWTVLSYVTFLAARIRGRVSFERATFSGRANFSEAEVVENAILLFDGEGDHRNEPPRAFHHLSDFRRIVIHPTAKVQFRKVDLSHVQFLESDIDRVIFSDVRWGVVSQSQMRALQGSPLPSAIWLQLRSISAWLVLCRRFVVADEGLVAGGLSGEKVLVAELYRKLQQNYVNSFRYTEAGDFYIGEQEMMRKAKGRWRQYFCVNNLYRIISLYGENYWLPFGWLLLAILAFPTMIMLVGPRYSWSWSPLNLVILNTEFWQTAVDSLLRLTPYRGSIPEASLNVWQKALLLGEFVIIISLITLFLLALRRKFKRKAF